MFFFFTFLVVYLQYSIYLLILLLLVVVVVVLSMIKFDVDLLGVSQLGVAVNKLDMVGWSRERFTEITTRLGLFLKQVGFKEQDIFYVPVSGLTGENLTAPPTETQLKEWYTGPSLVQAIGKSHFRNYN